MLYSLLGFVTMKSNIKSSDVGVFVVNRYESPYYDKHEYSKEDHHEDSNLIIQSDLLRLFQSHRRNKTMKRYTGGWTISLFYFNLNEWIWRNSKSITQYINMGHLILLSSIRTNGSYISLITFKFNRAYFKIFNSYEIKTVHINSYKL